MSMKNGLHVLLTVVLEQKTEQELVAILYQLTEVQTAKEKMHKFKIATPILALVSLNIVTLYSTLSFKNSNRVLQDATTIRSYQHKYYQICLY